VVAGLFFMQIRYANIAAAIIIVLQVIKLSKKES
jgi:hypothetical protein